MPAAMLANPVGLIFRSQPLLLPSANNSVSIHYYFIRHIRSTLRHIRFCGNRWDNYPISVSAAKMGGFVRDSNSAVTVKLPTQNPTDTLRR
jgi:hypothetical protein